MAELILWLTLGDLNRFPQREQVQAALAFNALWRHERAMDVRLLHQVYEKMRSDAQYIYDVWDALDNLWIAHRFGSPIYAIQKAAELKAILGEENYRLGLMPYPVPLQWVQRP